MQVLNDYINNLYFHISRIAAVQKIIRETKVKRCYRFSCYVSQNSFFHQLSTLAADKHRKEMLTVQELDFSLHCLNRSISPNSFYYAQKEISCRLFCPPVLWRGCVQKAHNVLFGKAVLTSFGNLQKLAWVWSVPSIILYDH